MSIVKRNGDHFSTLPTWFDNFLSRDFFDWNNSNFSDTGTTIPAVNIIDQPDNFEVEMAAPGMTKNDFKIELDNNLLTISSEKSEKGEKDVQGFTRREFSYQSFNRRFTLPQNAVDTGKIKAKYENGVLRLIIPKREEAKPRPPRMIEIG